MSIGDPSAIETGDWRPFSDALPSLGENRERISRVVEGSVGVALSRIKTNVGSSERSRREKQNGFLNDPAITGSWVCESRRSRREERGETTLVRIKSQIGAAPLICRLLRPRDLNYRRWCTGLVDRSRSKRPRNYAGRQLNVAVKYSIRD